jgi:hypothetical protein
LTLGLQLKAIPLNDASQAEGEILPKHLPREKNQFVALPCNYKLVATFLQYSKSSKVKA